MTNKKKAGFLGSAGMAAALTMFGHCCGSGFATGRQLIVYITRHGFKGILVPILSGFIFAFVLYFVFEISYLVKAKNYRDFGESFFGKYGKAFTSIWDIIIIVTAIVSTGSMMAGGGALLQSSFGGSYYLWLLIFAVFIILLVGFAGELVSKVGAMISTPLVCIMLLIIVSTILSNFRSLMDVMTGTVVMESTTTMQDVLTDTWASMGIMGGFIATACAMTNSFSEEKDVMIATVGGTLLIMILQILGGIAVFCGYPAINEELFPFKVLIQTTPLAAVLSLVYPIAVFLAITSTAYSIVMSLVVRLNKYTPKSIHKESVRDMVVALIVVVISTVIATSGFDAMIDKGYKFLGVMRMPTIIIPILIFGAWRIRAIRQQSVSCNVQM